MRSVPRPVHEAGETFALCISRVRRRELKHRLASVQADVVAQSAFYDNAGFASNLHTVASHDGVGVVTTIEMSNVYWHGMVRRTGPGRNVYNELLMAAPHSLCPFCGTREVKTLDHVLPRAHYPVFSVAPLNLVAAC